MESVNYEYFDSENDYSKNPNATKHRSFNVSRGDFSKYAILNGFYGKKLISRDARKFYSSMCRMAVKKEKGFYVISDEYEFAETSYKNVISFAMGMLATRIIANEIYNINKLYHFTDKSFKGTLVNGKMAPDWIGVDGQKKVFLFESKGTCNKNVRKKTIEHAKVQLNNVGSIKDTSTNQMYYPQKDSKHVICSCFDAYSGIDKVWNIHDVDPEGKGEVNLEINFDKECFMYYQAFVSYVDSLNQVYQCESVKNQKYYCWVYEDEKYCILEEIYNSMKSGQFNEQNRYRNFNNYVNEKLSDIEYPERFSHDGISSYEDGIVVCSSVSWRDKLH